MYGRSMPHVHLVKYDMDNMIKPYGQHRSSSLSPFSTTIRCKGGGDRLPWSRWSIFQLSLALIGPPVMQIGAVSFNSSGSSISSKNPLFSTTMHTENGRVVEFMQISGLFGIFRSSCTAAGGGGPVIGRRHSGEAPKRQNDLLFARIVEL
ncbi:hypothetical protein JCGZ_19322 [Jatropha curcas]|uniref:Uncharacterized protein n=1 Tax=Jatropha curcas TaxID=180498 RepID=A0A067K108_JATCU|nr:hypothetical protein JCGZ_19322 [Jatropha curcas]